MVAVPQALNHNSLTPEPARLAGANFPLYRPFDEDSMMTVSLPRAAQFLTIAVLASAVAVGCSKKVKETPPAETPVDNSGATTAPVTSTTPGAYTPADLDSDACLR